MVARELGGPQAPVRSRLSVRSTLVASRAAKPYVSMMTPETLAPSQRLRARLLDAVLPFAGDEGWNERTLARAAEVAGLSEGEAALAAPRGAMDLVAAFAQRADDEMVSRLAEAPLAGMKIRAKATLGVRARLEALAPYKAAVGKAAFVLARPSNAIEAAEIGWATADKIWRAIGDASTDENYYSKRALLAAVHGATLARWLNDASEGHSETWTFLDKRIENVMQVEKLKARLRPLEAVGPMATELLARLRYGLAPRR